MTSWRSPISLWRPRTERWQRRSSFGVEIGDAPLPPAQKRLIVLARDRNRVVITPTQMMESMIENHIPTRAEIFGGARTA